MAVTATVDSNSIAIKLNSGTSSSGTMKTVNINLTGIKSTALNDEDKQKVINIASSLANILEYPVVSTQITTRQILEEE